MMELSASVDFSEKTRGRKVLRKAMDKSGALDLRIEIYKPIDKSNGYIFAAIFEFASLETTEFSSIEGTNGGAEMLLAVCQFSTAKRLREWY
ncbi:hypothetical protein C5167_036795 [Papaver somniferum]|uniref:Uncharacterized protein n=1 Tax=Papaver somniferum TaxID=3469 RepID=A0A4Y7I4P5_PAPSO|nr:hypothetical protein C5167_036795 [Papaver somniferum]